MYVVTGGAGFIGSNLVAELAARGNEVVVVDWLRQDERWRNLAKHDVMDLVLPEALPAWLERHGDKVEAVLHMGANSSTTETDIDLLVRQNVRPTLDLLAWCTAHGKRLIYASSAATYGDGSAGFDDDASARGLARLLPLNAYGWSKHVVDRRITRLGASGGALPTQCAGLKFFNVYGPNEYHKGAMQSVIARSFASVRDGAPLRLFRSGRPDYADGGQLRDFIYVKDCVDVMLWLLANRHVSGLFNVGTGKARSWLDLARALFSAAQQPERIEFIDMPANLAGKYQYFTEARMERLRRAGYSKPFTTLEAGVGDYVQGYLSRGDPYR
ncbi:MAG: ADP-glyceromanno-heptose 6-epimerase [Proteobacteria bacterium]|nr:ADP-glyceromanno-heptose 6-epimerase [Pseudomonadota bacterium]